MHPYTHPYTHTQPKEEEVEQKQEKYVVRPPRDLTSQFEKRMKDKEQAQIEAEERKRREEEDARIAVSWSGGGGNGGKCAGNLIASVSSNGKLLRYKGHHFSYIRRQRPLLLTSTTVCVSTVGCWCCQGSVR